jgi:hypothetical protein
MPYNPNDSVVLQSQISDIQSELHLLTQNLAGGDGDLEERALWRAKQERLNAQADELYARIRDNDRNDAASRFDDGPIHLLDKLEAKLAVRKRVHDDAARLAS